MPGVGAWAWMAGDSVTIEPYASQNGAGEATYGTSVTYRARCVGKIQKVLDGMGGERVSTVTTYLMAAPTGLTPRDRITLPTVFSPRQPQILSVAIEPSERGVHHVVIFS